MKTNVYSVFDAKTDAFAQPFFAPTNGSALRSFISAAQDPATLLSKHPGDYSLYQIGEFDDDDGQIKAAEPIVNLGTAASFIAS
ncbi:MAG: nonstructural protein [Microvirus sp.]|nr:MAG: nonstructural protein [Microvirus sp.]